MKEYSIELKVEEVKVGEIFYEIRQMTTAGRSKYFKAQNQGIEVRLMDHGDKDEKGEPELRREIILKDLEGAQIELLCNTMFLAGEGKSRPVSREEINAWPAVVTEVLAKQASDLNGLALKEAKLEAEAEKN